MSIRRAAHRSGRSSSTSPNQSMRRSAASSLPSVSLTFPHSSRPSSSSSSKSSSAPSGRDNGSFEPRRHEGRERKHEEEIEKRKIILFSPLRALRAFVVKKE